MARTPWIVVALALTLLLAACVTGAAPALPPVVPMPEGVVFTQLAAGRDHVCGLTDDSMAVCWGRSHQGQLDVPDGMRFRHLTAGAGFTCGLRPDGKLVCWGRESADWLGGESGTWAMASAGSNQVCALDAEGAVACWGSLHPPPPEGGRYAAIGTGDNYGCGLTTAGGALECWGDDSGFRRRHWEHAGPFVALATGIRHLCALRPDGTALCLGPLESRIYPPAHVSLTHVTAGERHSCGLTSASTPVCWGSDEELPAGPFVALTSGWNNVCGLRPGGEARCWRMDGATRSLNATPALQGQPFGQPIELFPWPGGGLAIVDRGGTITVHAPGAPPRRILDLPARIALVGEGGLLSAALDPDFEMFPFIYAYYTAFDAGEAAGPARLSRFAVVDGRVDAESELVILEITQQSTDHNGGALRFGPAGMLHLGIGDDREHWDAQNPLNLRGAIVRIDVRGATVDAPYRVPDDNPLLDMPDARPEVWTWGLRNPWRMEFDARGRLWVADVGASREEEVSLAAPGVNLGWPVFEGTRCREGDRACAALDATPPTVSYGRDLGCAVIGGVHVPSNGAYLFGDHCSGRIWMLEDGADTGWAMREIARVSHHVLAFGHGVNGEVYVLTANGPILRIELPP